MSLGEKVKSRREEIGLSQEDLALKMGYKSRSSINKIEKGRPVSQKIICRLADALDVSVAYLMGWESEPDSHVRNASVPAANDYPMNPRDERDIQRRLKAALGDLEGETSALMFDGEPLDDETRELLIASLERTIRQAKIMAKEKYTPKKYRSKGSDAHEADPAGDK